MLVDWVRPNRVRMVQGEKDGGNTSMPRAPKKARIFLGGADRYLCWLGSLASTLLEVLFSTIVLVLLVNSWGTSPLNPNKPFMLTF